MAKHPGLQEYARLDNLQVVVRENTPFLPKVAFTLITLASLAGATFTGSGMGLGAGGLLMRWLTLWSLALAGGFLAWRLFYLREREADTDPDKVERLHATTFARADLVARWVGVLVVLGAPGALVVPYLADRPLLRTVLVAGGVVIGALLGLGVRARIPALVAALLILGMLIGWAYVDTGGGWPGAVRLLHLSAFTLWLGGALWNIAVAMPAGREHPNVDAVLAEANQLDRFRWVVRFALPTIIVTGVVMAWGYTVMPAQWWLAVPGILIPLKVLAIVALVVVFITCPLFRHCSPVQGVCNIDDLEEQNSP